LNIAIQLGANEEEEKKAHTLYIKMDDDGKLMVHSVAMWSELHWLVFIRMDSPV